MTDAELLATPVGFAVGVLGMQPYEWQARVMGWYEGCVGHRVQGSMCTPNGAGKDTVVIAALSLWWVFVHARGRVIITSADGKQIEDQTRPALHKHRAKFEGWDFNQWTITTPTGGRIRLYSTDDPGRVEGAHRDTFDDGSPDPDGPLLIVANEAKSLKDEILDAFDRCTFDGLLYASSPGFMTGRFYESQFKDGLGFKRCRVGLKDCPHVPQERIDSVIAKYGEGSAFVRSTLGGEFMEASSEQRFNAAGLKRLTDMAAAYDKDWRGRAQEQPSLSVIGELTDDLKWLPNLESGWLWRCEEPIPGCAYIGFCDPMTGEQSEGALVRDTHGAGILRLAYVDHTGQLPVSHNDEVVAVLHHEGGCRWDNDVMAERFSMLLKHFRCPAIVEANNSGTEVMRLLQMDGCTLWRRQKRDHRNPGKQLDVVGFQTNTATKNLWIGALGSAIREESLDCRYPPGCSQFATFVLNEKGTGEAQSGCHDDMVTGVGLGLFARASASKYPVAPVLRIGQQPTRGAWA